MSENEETQETSTGKVEVGTPEKDSEEIAAQLLTFYTPIYQNLVKQLTTNEMRRLLLKLIEYPLNEKTYQGNRKIEEQVFSIGQRLLESKFLLVMSTYAQNIEEMKKMAEENKEKENG
jgi:hypothetical protein